MDAGLAGLSEAEWTVHVEALRPTLGAAMVRILEGGRKPWEMRSVRGSVWERVRVRSVAYASRC